jgi:hypothetical protein
MLAHFPHVLIYVGLCALPLLILVWPRDLDHPRSDDPPDTDEEPEIAPVTA